MLRLFWKCRDGMEAMRRPAGRGICRVGLLECKTLVGESTDAAVASEIMVEGTIFLDEDDDVLDVSQFRANGWTGEAPPPPHPGRSTAASSVAAAAAPIFNNSRRLTFAEAMGALSALSPRRQDWKRRGIKIPLRLIIGLLPGWDDRYISRFLQSRNSCLRENDLARPRSCQYGQR